MAITGGSTCYCGTELPALDLEVDDSKCDSPCNGYDAQNCGGLGYWQLYLTGLTADVETAANSTSSADSAAATSTQATQTSATTQPAVVTKAGATVVVTASASTTASSAKSGGSSKVGIAVGVVVGVVAVAAIAGGTLLWFRHKRNRDIEDEHRRNAGLGTQSDKSSKTDQRLDPSIYSHRRQSIGSIADERDFSRRILQVSPTKTLKLNVNHV